jgi:hypothetical protein
MLPDGRGVFHVQGRVRREERREKREERREKREAAGGHGVLMNAAVCYEVLAEVDLDLAPAWEHYMLTEHIPDVLLTGCFVEARLDTGAPGQFRVRYRCANRETLDRYLAEHAPMLRAEATRRFPSGVRLERAIWLAGEPIGG